ncbi:MAG: hypothetical protein WD063_03125 [Pirellulales bacterium]
MSLLGSKSAKKKAAAGAAPAAVSAPATRGVVVEKPKANIYTVLLILTFVAIVIGCISLYAEMYVYDLKIKP